MPKCGTGAASLLDLSAALQQCFVSAQLQLNTTQTLLSLPGKHHASPIMKANQFCCFLDQQGLAAHLMGPGLEEPSACPHFRGSGRCFVSEEPRMAVARVWTSPLLHVQRRKTALKISKPATTFHCAFAKHQSLASLTLLLWGQRKACLPSTKVEASWTKNVPWAVVLRGFSPVRA